MANEIDLIVGQKAFDRITDLLTELGKVDTSFTELSAKFAALGNNTNTIKSTADLAKLTAENAKLNAVIEQQIKDFADLNAKLAQVNTARRVTTKGISEETVAQRELNAQNTLNIKATTDAVGAYAKLDAQHKLAVKTAQDLAVATGRTGQKYEEAKNKANELGNQLRVIDTDIGKHTRNVGNYSSSWNGLGNSINQLTREAPAFANSVQTGFMALSNNIPILTDEIGVLIQKNKDLQKDGKPTESILKTLSGAFFSWQTIISLGVTLLTVYGSKLYDMAKAAYESHKGISATSKAQESLNTAMSEGNKKASEEVGHFQTLYRTAINLNISQKERNDATNEMQKLYPKVLQNIKDETIQNGKAKDSYYLIRDAIIAKSRAAAISSELDKLAAEEFSKEAELRVRLDLEMNELYRRKDALESIKLSDNVSAAQIARVKAQYNNQVEVVRETNKEILELNRNLNKEQDILLKARSKEDSKADIIILEDPKKKEKQEKAKKEDLDHLESYIKPVGTIIDEINKEIDRLFTEKIIANAQELPAVNFQLEMLYKLRSQLNELPTGGALPDNFVKPEQVEGLKQLTKEMQNYLQSFINEFASKSNFEGILNLFEGEDSLFSRIGDGMAFTKESWKSDTISMMEAAQEMYNFIDSTSQANFEKEYARLDAQKETSLKFAGENTAAKEKIEADYEKKRKEIELREFKQKQKSAVINIAIDTAQAILATFAKTPPPAGIPLAAAIGVLGAIQAGVVLSQKPPAYAEGTDNHSGGLMLVNDGAGSNYQEKVILPSGKVIRPQGRNVLMDAPKGTKVLNHEQQLFEMLQSNNISMSSQANSGMTSEEMDEILGKHFGNIKTQNTIFDKNGFQTYVRNGNSITRSNSNRSQAIGISV